MAKFKLNARDIAGKKVKNLRAAGQVPAAMFGPKFESANVAVEVISFKKLYADVGHSKLVDVELPDGSTEKVLIKEVQRNPVTDEFLHASLYVIDKNSAITAEVPVIFEGLAKAVDMGLGFLVEGVDNIVIRCLPANLPSEMRVDVSKLADVGDSIAVADLVLPEGVELDTSMDLTTAVVYVSGAQKVEVEPEVVAETEEGAEGEVAAEGEAGAEAETAAAE